MNASHYEPFDPVNLRATLAELLRSLLGTSVRLTSVEVAKQMHDYRVVLVELEAPKLSLVVKLAGPQAELACPFERTAALLRLVGQRTRVPVNRLVAADTSCRDWPWRYLVNERRPGAQWVQARQQMDEDSRQNGYAQIGEAVAELHAIQFAGFGELPPSLNLPANRDFSAAWTERARAFIPDERLRTAFLSALEPRQELFVDLGPASLCHEDLHAYNLLFEQHRSGWRLSGVLDFDKAWAGCRESDLARLEFWDGMSAPAFWQAYQGCFPMDPAYPRRRLLYQLFWCLEYARPTPRHQADTARVCRALRIPEIHLVK